MALPNPIIEPISYVFGPFRLDPDRRALQKDGGIVPLTAKAFDLLVILVENRHQPVSKEELMQKVWPENKTVTDNTFSVTLSMVRKALGESAKEPRYIVKAPGGYRFVAEVQKIPANGEASTTQANVISLELPAGLESFLGGHLWFVLASGALYGLLYAVALLVEVAYRFDQYGRGALLRAPMVWLWAGAVSFSSLALDGWLTHERKQGGLMASLLVSLSGIVILVIVVWSYLPPIPITEMDVQAYTAQAAYLKTVSYFVFLQIFFQLIPFHFVLLVQRELQAGRSEVAAKVLLERQFSFVPRGAIFIRVWMLGLLLILLVLVSLFLHHSLMSHLRSTQFMNLFANLILTRLILYHIFGGVCLWWYYQSLNDLKRECLGFSKLTSNTGEQITMET